MVIAPSCNVIRKIFVLHAELCPQSCCILRSAFPAPFPLFHQLLFAHSANSQAASNTAKNLSADAEHVKVSSTTVEHSVSTTVLGLLMSEYCQYI